MTSLVDCCLGDTDKGWHGYLPHYERHLEPEKIETLTEIGVWTGGSLRMWQRWLPKAHIIGIDIEPANYIVAEGFEQVHFIEGDATSMDVPWSSDVIIDDGSHKGPDIVQAFYNFWPTLRSGGWYVIEDLASLRGPTFNPRPARELLDLIVSTVLIGGEEFTEAHQYEQILFVKKR